MDDQAVGTLGVSPPGEAEAGLITETQWDAVQAAFERGTSRKAIAREVGLDVKTVRKWLRRGFAVRRRRSRGRVLDGFGELLRARSVEVGFNAAVLSREIQGQGDAGGYAALARYVAPWRAGFRAEEAGTVRFETGPGERSQVHWGSRWVHLGTRATGRGRHELEPTHGTSVDTGPAYGNF
jgi:transposase-like protein